MSGVPLSKVWTMTLGQQKKQYRLLCGLKHPQHLLTRLKDEMEACDTETNSHILFLIFSLEIELKLKQQ